MLIGSVLLIVFFGFVNNPIYDSEDDLKSYVGVCKEIDRRKGGRPYGRTYLVMTDGREFRLLDQVDIEDDIFRKAVENFEIFRIGYNSDSVKPSVVTLEIGNRVYFSLEQWNSVSKTNIIAWISVVVLINLAALCVSIPPKYKRIENRNRKAKEKAKKAKLKEKAKAEKANS